MSFTVTPEHLAAIAGRTTALMPALADWMNTLCPSYEIDTAREYGHFLAQACHETDHFKTLREYASGSAYEGRADLGNTQAGDGIRFRGRGIFQTTGRANYLQLGIKKGRDHQAIATMSMQMAKHIDMGKTVQIAQTQAELRIDFNAALHIGRAPGLDGHALQTGKG